MKHLNSYAVYNKKPGPGPGSGPGRKVGPGPGQNLVPVHHYPQVLIIGRVFSKIWYSSSHIGVY